LGVEQSGHETEHSGLECTELHLEKRVRLHNVAVRHRIDLSFRSKCNMDLEGRK